MTTLAFDSEVYTVIFNKKKYKNNVMGIYKCVVFHE